MSDDVQAILAAWGAFLFAGVIFLTNLEGNRRMRSGDLPELWVPKGDPDARWKMFATRIHWGMTMLLGFTVAVIGLFAMYVTVVLLSLGGLL